VATPLGSILRDGEIDAFLDGTAGGRFLLRRCRQCAAVGGPSEVRCGACGSWDTEGSPAIGGAELVSWSIVHGPAADGSTAPRAVVVIAQLDEGPWWWSQLLDADPGQLRTGTRLRIDYEPAEGGEVLPVFRLA
jgi:uncharacterized OB-fold protein